MALSFHVIFSDHDALFFRVPTWGLVFLMVRVEDLMEVLGMAWKFASCPCKIQLTHVPQRSRKLFARN